MSAECSISNFWRVGEIPYTYTRVQHYRGTGSFAVGGWQMTHSYACSVVRALMSVVQVLLLCGVEGSQQSVMTVI